jgi:hypothetical protein
LHFGPLNPTPTDAIDERDDYDDDDNGWLVGGVIIRSPQPTPPGTSYPPPREQPTPPTVSSSDSEDVGVKLTVDDDIDKRDNDDDDNGYLVDGVIIHSDQSSPAINAAAVRGLPTPITVSSFDNEDVGVKPTVDDGPIVAAAEGILRLPSKPKVSQSRCCLVLLGSFSVFGGRMGQNWREIYACATMLVSRLVFCHTNNVSLRSSFISRNFLY